LLTPFLRAAHILKPPALPGDICFFGNRWALNLAMS
jgi:hypothetical protein